MKKKLKCILLIDDDEPTNYISKMLIEEAGCAEHVEVAQSGQKALDYLTSSENAHCDDSEFPCPDLIFLDINMPAMNGWEFLEKYEGLPVACRGNVIMVMLTTSLNPEDKQKASEIPDISGFESKPLTSEKLERILRKHYPGYF
jgi:CheY-like chemotaxis protein